MSISKTQRRRIKKRQLRINQALKRKICKGLMESTCRYCLRQFKVDELTIEHVIPLSLGGNNELPNIDLACKPCNMQKGKEAFEFRRQQRKSQDMEKYHGKQGIIQE